MASKLAITVAVTALLFLFSFSHARSPLDQLDTEVIGSDRSSVDLPESNSKAGDVIILPSERLESEPVTFVETKPDESDSELHETETGKTELKQEKPESQTDSVPLTVISFRPINHHFDRRPFFPFRRGHKCHGHRNHRFNRLNEFRSRFGQRFDRQARISYGNDMIIAKDQGFDPVSLGGNQMWNRFNHHGGQFVNDEMKSEEMNNMPHRHHHRHHHHDDEEGEEKEHRHEHMSGFMKGIRKFLGHF